MSSWQLTKTSEERVKFRNFCANKYYFVFKIKLKLCKNEFETI